MSNAELIGILAAVIFGIIGIIALIYTIYYGRKGLRRKLLVYENSISLPLAQAFSPEEDYSLSVVFQRKDSIEERISSVYTTFLKLANLGREPIRGLDIAPTNPINVNVEGARTLDIQISATTRKVNNVSIVNRRMDDNDSSAEIKFDFLDYQDGALINILTVGNKGKIWLSGDIIGMPEGIKNFNEEPGKESGGTEISGWAFIIMLLIVGVVSAFIYYWVVGSWTNVWLVFIILPILLISVAAFAIVPEWIRPNRTPSFPETLELPKWCQPLFWHSDWYLQERLAHMRLRDESVRKKPKSKGHAHEL
ncbi:MAG: hypothetical protein WC566_06385 [Dehalococcoidia bacterium]